jgi:hypothetical protein
MPVIQRESLCHPSAIPKATIVQDPCPRSPISFPKSEMDSDSYFIKKCEINE